MRQKARQLVLADARMAINPPVALGPEYPVDELVVENVHAAAQRCVSRGMQKATNRMIEDMVK